MKLAIGLLCAVLAASGCGKSDSKPQDEPPSPDPAQAITVPEDFKVVSSSGPVQRDVAPSIHVEVASGPDGYTIVERQERKGIMADQPVDAPRSRALTDKEVATLWTVVESEFLPLEQKSYTDPDVMDGGSARITVTAGGKTKSVTVSNASVPGFDAVRGKLTALLRTAKRAPPTAVPDDFTVEYERATLTAGNSKTDQKLSLSRDGEAWVLIQEVPVEARFPIGKDVALVLYALANDELLEADSIQGNSELTDGTASMLVVFAKGAETELRVFDTPVPAFDAFTTKLRQLARK